MANLKLVVCAMVVCMVVSVTRAQTLNCHQVIDELGPCLWYLSTDSGGSVPLSCCAGVKALNYSVQTTADSTFTCVCFQTASSSISGFNSSAAADIPTKCGLNVSYQLGATTTANCASLL